ncbi:unnamed protein product [Rotaria sp. Silwood1]|nr:unnamed protein product [Rotaria sp. Silwood1]CAF4922738.1 unnamed protein product [Rotaria sp. Silwood1]
MRLNKIIYDQTLTTSLTLFRWSSDVYDVIYSLNDTIIDRFCLEILLKIHYKIKWLNIESLSMERILRIVDYPNLYGLGLYNINEETFKRLFIATYLPSNEEIQQTFINFMNNKVITCVDYFPKQYSGQCRIYSYPYTMNYYRKITNKFPGGLFKYVCEVSLFDESSFKHEFFLRIAQSFPFLKALSVNNRIPQKYKQCRTSNDDNQDPLIIKYFHLIDLTLLCVHADYVEQFLDPTKTSILNNISLYVDYYRLRKATHNFKRNDMRINCSKVTNLRLFGSFQISKHFKAYFPNVKHQ